MTDVESHSEEGEAAVESADPNPVAWRQRAALGALLVAVFAIGFVLTQQLLADDDPEDLAGELLLDGGVLLVRSETQGAVIDLRDFVPGYGGEASPVGFASDGDGGFVAGFSAAADTDGTVVHVPAGGMPELVVEAGKGGVGRLIGVWDGIAVYQEAMPLHTGVTDGDNPPDQLSAVVTVDLETGETSELALTYPASASMGGSRVLVASDDGCAMFVVLDLIDGSSTTVQPFPDDPGCFDRTFVPEGYISRDGSSIAYLRLWDSEIEAVVLSIDDPAEPTMRLSASRALLLSDVENDDFLEMLGRDVFDVEVAASLLSDLQDLS